MARIMICVSAMCTHVRYILAVNFVAQNIDRGTVKANSIKAKVYEAIRKTGIARKRVKKISSSIDTSKTAKSSKCFEAL